MNKPISQDEYVLKKGEVCPNCLSPQLTLYTDTYKYCNICKYSWEDVVKLIGYKNLTKE